MKIDTTPIPYFAYGSNLHRGDMSVRCPDASAYLPATLSGWHLTFRGVADIEPARGGTVHGGLWWLSEADLASLDRYEGAPTHYRRLTVKVTTTEGPLEALTYVMTHNTYLGLPSVWYFERIAQGYRDWDLPTVELRRALSETRDRLHCLGVRRYSRDGRKRLRAVVEPDLGP